MAQSGGSIPGCIDGNPDLSCDDEIGAGRILEQVSKIFKSTRGGEGVTANNPPGFAPGTRNRDAESHNIDIKDEKPKNTDFVIQKPNNKELLELSAAMAYTLYATGMQATLLMPKYYSRTILVLLGISLTSFLAVKLLYKKIPPKIANLATSLAIACNGSSVLLFSAFFLAKT